MICVYPSDCTDFSSNGLGAIMPMNCTVTETLNGEWELTLTHPIDDAGKWTRLAEGNILRAPVPAAMTPRVDLVTQQYQTTTYDVHIYKITTKSGPLRLRSGTGTKYKILGKYKKGKEVIVLDKTTSSWYEITAPDGKHGYMSSQYLTFQRTETQSVQTNVGFRNDTLESRQLRDQPFRIYDSVREATSTAQISSAIITCENNKLREKYAEYLNKRTISPERNSTTPSISEITTDDERIVLFYLLHNTVRKATKATIIQWLNEKEIHSVNVDNAFDLLSSFHGSKLSDDTLELDIGAFRKYTSNAEKILPELKDCVERHILLSANAFGEKWDTGAFDSIIKLFTAYIIDEKVSHFGARWMTEGQTESIRAWENKNQLDSTLSENYSSCIELFIHDKFVYESDWTSYGNPKEYALYPSLKKLLFDCPQPLLECIERIKQEYKFELPF